MRSCRDTVTISLGVSAGSGQQVDYDTLFPAADGALYQAKRAGRDRVVAVAPADFAGATEPAAEIWASRGQPGSIPDT